MKSSWLLTLVLGLGSLVVMAGSLPEQTTRGEVQLEAITKTRPRMARSLVQRPGVREWIIKRFNRTSPPIVWDPKRPMSGRLAEFDARNPDTTFVRVMAKASGIDQLTHLLFELHNIEGYQQFNAIHESATRKEIQREEYARKMLEVEFEALLQLRAFLEEHVSDLTVREREEARGYYRLLHGPETLDEHERQIQKRGFDLRDHYRELWDSDVVPAQGSPSEGPR